ncbi:MAG TPA: hypothetical protein VNW68_02710, partial [Candidatus Limnocylindria bacterium]|nr:hypothetical protein [Candidatus Limnocylindria bacterium]
MAVRALPPGTARRRAAFGLLDADGWTWAGIKALFWFLLIIFLLGYVPDRAYYMTVLRTIDFGYNVVSPINLCPPENRTLPCPAPAGSVVPWQPNSAELTLPAGRSGAGVFASGENFYIVGGETAEGATASVLATVVDEDGNPGEWQEAAALPEPRADAAVINLAGIPYVIGGRDGGGNATDTVFVGTLEEGQLTGWETSDELVLPEPRYDAAGAATATSIWVIGGRNADGEVVSATYRSMLSEAAVPVLEPWQVVIELPLPEPRAAATAASVGT